MRTRKLAVLALAGALAVGAFGLPFLARRQREKQRGMCLEHLRQVNQPLNCCIPLENKLKPGDSVDPKLIFDYLKMLVEQQLDFIQPSYVEYPTLDSEGFRKRIETHPQFGEH